MKKTNNPGNIRSSSAYKWMGQIGTNSQGFTQFQTPAYGIRALYITICNYIKIHGRKTIPSIISRYAPPSENDTQGYINFVLDYCEKGPHDIISTHQDILHICIAITKMENTPEDRAYFFEHFKSPAMLSALRAIHKSIFISNFKTTIR